VHIEKGPSKWFGGAFLFQFISLRKPIGLHDAFTDKTGMDWGQAQAKNK